MLENIALIASVISALSALTTSLRAVGVSKEYHRHDQETALKTASRLSSRSMNQVGSQRSSLRLHLLVTAIWYGMALLFSIPYVTKGTEGGSHGGLHIWILSFLTLAAVIFFIWQKAVLKR